MAASPLAIVPAVPVVLNSVNAAVAYVRNLATLDIHDCTGGCPKMLLPCSSEQEAQADCIVQRALSRFS